jgi:hypothetical protein
MKTKSMKRSYGQKKRRAKESLAELLVNLIWGILKWTIFLPFTLIFKLLKRK